MTADAPKRSAEQPAAQAAQGFSRGFSRSGRLLKHSDFERVYKQGRRHFSSHMTVFYLRREEDPQPRPVLTEPVLMEPVLADLVQTKTSSPDTTARVGFTVGRVLGGAVERNRIKRRLREAVRLRRSALQGAGAVDVVINPKKSVLSVEFSVVLEEVGRALEVVAKKMVGK